LNCTNLVSLRCHHSSSHYEHIQLFCFSFFFLQ
jgi:hypothetical protein